MRSSHTMILRSNEHDARIGPNSGCAHASRQIEPACAFHSLSFWPTSSYTRIDWSDDDVAIRRPYQS